MAFILRNQKACMSKDLETLKRPRKQLTFFYNVNVITFKKTPRISLAIYTRKLEKQPCSAAPSSLRKISMLLQFSFSNESISFVIVICQFRK